MNTSLQRYAVINVVGLTTALLDRMPRLKKWANRQQLSTFPPVFPAVTCSAQASYLTGKLPKDHGIIGNGWYNKELCEVQFWKQPNQLIRGQKIWHTLRQRYGEQFTCAQICWQFNMYADVDWSITPRPMYPADGRKVFDIYTHPMTMRESIKNDLGDFPFPWYWGPNAGLPSSQWIAQAAQWVEDKHHPTLNLIYLPHLDYCLQKWGPLAPQIDKELKDFDKVVSDLISSLIQQKVSPLILSEYGISPVSTPIYLNREFRQKGWISIKQELGHDMLDCGDSSVFAVADHQIAHIYLNNPELYDTVYDFLLHHPHIETVYKTKELWGENTTSGRRAGDFIVSANPEAWFAYYFWLDDKKAPDYARSIDIHRKPGYDPVELFINPKLICPYWNIAKFLIRKKLGFRTLMDIIPLDATLVKGSHGRTNVPLKYQPVCITPPILPPVHQAQDIYNVILQAISPSSE